jgi:RNA polymerase sigma factor (TIGR02999 family)
MGDTNPIFRRRFTLSGHHTMRQPESVSAAELVARHYEELRGLAHALMRRERPGHTLDTTGLVNEAYLRLAGQTGLHEHERTRFFAIATNTMRRILVDHARGRGRLKRGGGATVVPLDDVSALLSEQEADELVVLDDALARLEQVNPRGSEVVEYRFFGGLSLEETAQLLGVSSKTVQRDWLAARAWLRKEVARDLGLPP